MDGTRKALFSYCVLHTKLRAAVQQQQQSPAIVWDGDGLRLPTFRNFLPRRKEGWEGGRNDSTACNIIILERASSGYCVNMNIDKFCASFAEKRYLRRLVGWFVRSFVGSIGTVRLSLLSLSGGIVVVVLLNAAAVEAERRVM